MHLAVFGLILFAVFGFSFLITRWKSKKSRFPVSSFWITTLVAFVISLCNGAGEPLRVAAIESHVLPWYNKWYEWVITLGLFFTSIMLSSISAIIAAMSLSRPRKLQTFGKTEPAIIEMRSVSGIYEPEDNGTSVLSRFFSNHGKRIGTEISIAVFALLAVEWLRNSFYWCKKQSKNIRRKKEA